MFSGNLPLSRRAVVQAFGLAAASGLYIPGAFAEALTETARLTEGPFYPDHMPLDTDNDLLILNDSITPAVGEITYLSGVVQDVAGKPIRNAFVEIWQVDSTASYLHTRGRNKNGNDANFQGYGRFLTDSHGRYHFRTIKPVPYPGRTPHIHVAVSQNGRRVLTTQLLIKGHPKNENDGVFRNLRDPKDRDTLLVNFEPIPDSKLKELNAHFDIVLGKTAFEDEQGTLRGVAPAQRSRG